MQRKRRIDAGRLRKWIKRIVQNLVPLSSQTGAALPPAFGSVISVLIFDMIWLRAGYRTESNLQPMVMTIGLLGL